MAEETHVNDGGTWRKASEIHVRSGGVWRKAKEVFVRVSGVWQRVYIGVTGTFAGGNWPDEFNKSTNTVYFSPSKLVNVTGGTISVSVSTTGGGEAAQIQKNGSGSYVDGPLDFNDGDSIKIRMRSSTSTSSAKKATVSMTGDSAEWEIWTT